MKAPHGVDRHFKTDALVHRAGASRALPLLFWNSTADGIFALHCREDGRFIFEGANPAFIRMADLGDFNLVAMEASECLTDDWAPLLSRCRDCVLSGAPLRYEELVGTPAGPRWRRVELNPVRESPAGAVHTVVGKVNEWDAEAGLFQADQPAQRLLRQIVDTSPDVIYVFDLIAGRNVFLNNRVRRTLGFPVELLQKLDTEGLLQLVHPDDLPTVRQHMADLLQLEDGAVASAEFRCLTGHSGYRWFRTKETIFSRTRKGRVEKVVGILSDIDRLKKARIAFTETNARLKSILASISDCYLTVDRECRITAANSAAAKWLGRTRATVVGRKLNDVVAHASARKPVMQAIREKRTVNVEIPSYIHPGRWIDVRAYPSREGVSVFFSDVTQRKLAEQAAARSDALLNASLDALSVQIAILNKDGTIVACNEAWRCFVSGLRLGRDEPRTGSNLFGFYERIGRNVSEARRIAQRVRSILGGRLKATRHIYHVDLGDGERWYQLAAAGFTHAGDTFAVIATEDVTDARHARQTLGELSERVLTLQEDERQRIATELHNSTAQHLAAIGLNAMVLKARPHGPAGNEHLWNDVEQSLERATRELRAFMYLMHPVRLGTDGFNDALRRFVAGFTARTGLKSTLKLGTAVEHLPNPLQLSLLRIVQEVLVNAHVHTLATRLSITQTCAGDRVHLVIRDNGAAHKGAAQHGRTDQRPLGVGLPAMRERLRRVGGNLEIRINRRGTIVDASVPNIRQARAHPHPGAHARTGVSVIRRASERKRVPSPRRRQNAGTPVEA